jgi:hypothetical protein
MTDHYMKVPCIHCPFRRDVKPFLRAAFAEDLAYSAGNKYNSFPCHKTTDHSGEDKGQMKITERTKECAGFLTLRAADGIGTPEGFEPSFDLCYTDAFEMIQTYYESESESE